MRALDSDDSGLHRLFSGMVEQVFQTRVGICDPSLTDYLGDLLSDFVHVDQIYRLRSVDGQTIREVSRMEAEACLGPVPDETSRSCLVHRFIGDFTLFWTGVFPESLRPRHAGVDRLREYLAQGRRSYGIAGELAPPNAHPPGVLLRKLSHEFEACVFGLQLVREELRQIGRG